MHTLCVAKPARRGQGRASPPTQVHVKRRARSMHLHNRDASHGPTRSVCKRHRWGGGGVDARGVAALV
eukprot:358364-Chlamydomonas_euryale.AAC.4